MDGKGSERGISREKKRRSCFLNGLNRARMKKEVKKWLNEKEVWKNFLKVLQ